MRWRITNVELEDFLGIQGNFSQSFDDSTQVIFAKNNTGKSTLTLGIQWALTGNIPKIRGIDKKSFSLVNKHAGKEMGYPCVTLTLSDENGREMTITRRGHKEPRRSKGVLSPQLTEMQEGEEGLEVDLDGMLHAGWEDGQEIINKELGLTCETLRQCGVVLQQDILMLIAGQTNDISSVINDTLGLEALSDLVPILDEKVKEANRKHRVLKQTCQEANPYTKWQEKMNTYREQLESQETEAINAGIPKEEVEDPEKAIQERFDFVGKQLDLSFNGKGDKMSICQNGIKQYRSNNPATEKYNHAKVNLGNIKRLTSRIKKLKGKWEKASKQFSKVAIDGVVDYEIILKKAAENDSFLEKAKNVQEDLEREEGFLATASNFLDEHTESNCPLCRQEIDIEVLRQDVRDRLSAKIKAEMREVKIEIKRLKNEKKNMNKQKKELEKFIEQSEKLVDEYNLIIDEPDYSSDIEFSEYHKTQLFTDINQYKEPIGEMNRILGILEARQDEWIIKQDTAEKEMKDAENLLTPLENSLREIDAHFRQIKRFHTGMENHQKLESKAINEGKSLEKSLEKAKEFTSALQKIKKEITSQQLERANAAIKTKIPLVNQLFSRIAANPDYNSINAQARISSDKIKYELNAESSKVASLGDKVCHVLSEGNLHVAGLSLLLALSRGDKHNLGFVLLDDPGQGMDDDTMERFSQAIMSLEDKPQTIILTHQQKLAKAMEKKGASRKDWGTWEGGRISGP